MIRQTLRSPINMTGIGIRSGNQVSVRVIPSVGGCGIILERSDIDQRWCADLTHALDVPGCTAIGDEIGRVDFVEHILAALWAVGITDARIIVDGPEIPLLDGSAAPWLRKLQEAGRSPVDAFAEPISLESGIFDIGEDTAIMALPADELTVAYSLVHSHPMIGHQYADFRAGKESFEQTLAPARTFATIEELEELLRAGFITAGSEANCLVVYGDDYSQEPFAPNAFARHKLVDLLGDLYLLGRPLQMQVVAYRTGHKDNRRLAAKVLEDFRSRQ